MKQRYYRYNYKKKQYKNNKENYYHSRFKFIINYHKYYIGRMINGNEENFKNLIKNKIFEFENKDWFKTYV